MAVKERTRASKETLEKAYKEVTKYEDKHGFKRGEFKPFLEKVAEKHGLSWHSLKNRYYRDGKTITKVNEEESSSFLDDVDETLEKEKTTIDNAVENHKQESESKEEQSQQIKFTVEETETGRKRKILNENPYSAYIDIDSRIEASSHTPAQRILHQPKDIYKVGQLVKVKVSNIQSYGAFVEIMDGRGFQALVHISELVEGYIKKVTDYIDVNDIIENAKITMIDNKRMNITLKHLNLQSREGKQESIEELNEVATNPAINVIGEKFGTLKDKLMERAVVVHKGNDLKEIDDILAQELLTESHENILKKYERDIDHMTTYLQDELGALTPQAKLELAKMIDEQGVFNTTRGIMLTQENFKADIGLLFMQQMKSKLGEYL